MSVISPREATPAITITTSYPILNPKQHQSFSQFIEQVQSNTHPQPVTIYSLDKHATSLDLLILAAQHINSFVYDQPYHCRYPQCHETQRLTTSGYCPFHFCIILSYRKTKKPKQKKKKKRTLSMS